MSALRIVVCALLGVPAAWFAGVLIDRVPDKLALFDPPPGLRVRGKYLVVDVAMVVLFAAVGWRFEDAPILAVAGYLLLVGTLVTLSVIDIELFRLPDRIVLPALAISVPLVAVTSIVNDHPEAIRYALTGSALYFGFLFLAHLIYPRGMGFGDVKLAALMGLYVGWLGASYPEAIALVLWAMLVGFVSGSIAGIVLLAARRRSKPIPFGPFLALGTIVVVLLGRGLVAA